MTRKYSLRFSLRLAAVVPVLLLSVARAGADDQEQKGAVKLLAPILHVGA